MKIAITGSIGSGKSQVSDCLRALGYSVIDADKLAHDCYRPNTPIYDYLIETYSDDIINEDGTINRKVLAQSVFKDEARIRDLEAQVFPCVKAYIETCPPTDSTQFFELSMLYEAHMETLFDAVWVVDVDDDKRHKRLLDRGMSVDDIERREKRQLPTKIKCKRADLILDNNGTISQLREQISASLERMHNEN